MTTDSDLDRVALNREILLHPSEAGINPSLARLEQEQPGLEGLCPLTRAIYWIETGRSERVNAGEALANLWCIDDSEAQADDGDYDVVEEVVDHSITTSFHGVDIRLGFRSCTEMTHHQDYWPRYVRAASALDWDQAVQQRPASWIEGVFLGLDQSTMAKRSPEGYPTDSGDFIGTCSYTLITVNGLPVNGPTLSDSSYEQEWENLNDQFMQRWVEDDEDSESAFCWLHSLTPEMAERLGIAARGGEALGDDQEEYPAWMPKTLLKNSDAFWIDADQIQASYSRGSVIVDPSTRAWMAIGCGAAWDPTDPDSQLDPAQSERWDQFPETMGPLLRVEVSREDVDLPPMIKELFPYWQKLIQLHGQINKALTREEEP